MDARDGVVTTDELRALGFTTDDIAGMVRRNELIRVRRGLYRGRGVRWDLRAQLRAGLSEHGDEARLVLISALHWQGLLYRPADVPQIGLPGESEKQRHPGSGQVTNPAGAGFLITCATTCGSNACWQWRQVIGLVSMVILQTVRAPSRRTSGSAQAGRGRSQHGLSPRSDDDTADDPEWAAGNGPATRQYVA